MQIENKLALLVLSCDKYSYAWDDFFNLRDKFWPDCPYPWYVVTETAEYNRDGVTVIKCGKEMNWTGRFKYAAEVAGTKYIGMYLEDLFIEAPIDNKIIEEDLAIMEKLNISMINTGEEHGWIASQPNKEFAADNLMVIPKHLRYGISATSAIWESSYLIEFLGKNDRNAWDFEMDCCQIAASEEGYKGLLLCDLRQPLHPSRIPVIVQGKLYPKSIKHFKERGYHIDTSKYTMMTPKEIFKWRFKHYAAKIPFGRKPMKWVATHILGYEFFSDEFEKQNEINS